MPYKDKAAATAWARRWRQRNKTRSNEIRRNWYERNKIRVMERRRERLSDPVERANELCRSRFRFAVKRGWIKRPGGNLVFHHPEYSRPYYGVWITQADHMLIHAGLIECPTCVDYEEYVNEQRILARAEGARKGAEAANKVRWG